MRTRPEERDAALELHRQALMSAAERDLAADPDVIAVYYGGSIGKGEADRYSDIDLRTVVRAEAYEAFIQGREERAGRWGRVLFSEPKQYDEPALAVHYDSFLTIDWMIFPEDRVLPSHWLRRILIVHDPLGLMQRAAAASASIREQDWELAAADVSAWASQALAAAHDAYRSCMRGELLQAMHELAQFRSGVAAGWDMEDGRQPRELGNWRRVGGVRSAYSEERTSLMLSSFCGPERDAVLRALDRAAEEFDRLLVELCMRAGLNEWLPRAREALAMVRRSSSDN